jgi:hypothetical protein
MLVSSENWIIELNFPQRKLKGEKSDNQGKEKSSNKHNKTNFK